MAGLSFVGVPSSDPEDIVNRGDLNDILGTAVPNRTSVSTNVIDAVALKASKSFIDNADAGFVLPSYYQTRDALNIATSARGVANGVAALDASTKIPVPQLPTLGSGYLVGPFGPKHQDNSPAVFGGSTGATPMRIADWELGEQAVTSFRALVFMSALVSCTANGQPVIEVRVSDGTAPYASQTLVARGSGRTFYTDRQTIAVLPCPDALGQVGTTSPPTYDTPYFTAWLFDAHSSSVTISGSGITSAVLHLLRSAE